MGAFNYMSNIFSRQSCLSLFLKAKVYSSRSSLCHSDHVAALPLLSSPKAKDCNHVVITTKRMTFGPQATVRNIIPTEAEVDDLICTQILPIREVCSMAFLPITVECLIKFLGNSTSSQFQCVSRLKALLSSTS